MWLCGCVVYTCCCVVVWLCGRVDAYVGLWGCGVPVVWPCGCNCVVVWLCGCVAVWPCRRVLEGRGEGGRLRVGSERTSRRRSQPVCRVIHSCLLGTPAIVDRAILIGAACIKQGHLALALFRLVFGAMACADTYVSMGNGQVGVGIRRRLGGHEQSVPVVFVCHVLLVSIDIERLVYVSPQDRQHAHAPSKPNLRAGNPDRAQCTRPSRGASRVRDAMITVRMYRMIIADISYISAMFWPGVGDAPTGHRRLNAIGMRKLVDGF